MSATETEHDATTLSAGAWVIFYTGAAALVVLATAMVYAVGGLPAALVWGLALPMSILGVSALL